MNESATYPGKSHLYRPDHKSGTRTTTKTSTKKKTQSRAEPANGDHRARAAMDFWSRARTFAEEAARRSQELTAEAAKRSQELAAGGPSRLADVVSETAKRSREIAAEASRRADQIKLEAIRRADRLRSLAAEGSGEGAAAGPGKEAEEAAAAAADLERFGVTDELREFVQEINVTTFRDFPLPDDSEMSDVPMVSNVRQDLTEFQEKHAKLVLSSVKEISKLRYELCPRIMKERKFWRIYFILVNSHVALYERRYMEDVRQNASEEVKDVGQTASEEVKDVGQTASEEVKDVGQTASEEVKEHSNAGVASKAETKEPNNPSKLSKTSTSTEQDLDVFLLGDLGDDDEGPDAGDADFDDDFDKMGDSSDDEKEKEK
ncbi:hypothetical protein EUGRSUZ_B00640 [Eucalyptus grandis]|uniref:Uncharacterized protein n=2 Tax=Eucalyptus grandis TaxID=71139 RepID=A0ACC3LNC9_EUCGR|nr:hypothetical protein EUGRSUZ_B00640 [Eucalyptus grandis]